VGNKVNIQKGGNMEVNKNGMLLVGDWLGEQDGNKFWTNEDLAFWYPEKKKSLKRSIQYVKTHTADDTFIQNGCYCPTEDLKTVKAFRKEINRRKGHRYIGVKGGNL